VRPVFPLLATGMGIEGLSPLLFRCPAKLTAMSLGVALRSEHLAATAQPLFIPPIRHSIPQRKGPERGPQSSLVSCVLQRSIDAGLA